MSSYDESAPSVVALRDAVQALQSLAASTQESLGVHRLKGSGAYAYRRLTDPLLVPVGKEPTRFEVPKGFFDEGGPGFGATSFGIWNPNNCPVRLRGTSAQHGPFRAVSLTTGWVFGPGASGPFSTQYPVQMSAMFYPCMGLSVPVAKDWLPLEVHYGGGM